MGLMSNCRYSIDGERVTPEEFWKRCDKAKLKIDWSPAQEREQNIKDGIKEAIHDNVNSGNNYTAIALLQVLKMF